MNGHRSTDPEKLYTITAGGFSATADAFAVDTDLGQIWFVSMVGSQTALKAISAAMLNQPPTVAYLSQGLDSSPLHPDSIAVVIPPETIGTWTTKLTRPPLSGAWHNMTYTKTAQFNFENKHFLLLTPHEQQAPELHYIFLNQRSSLPLHPSWPSNSNRSCPATTPPDHKENDMSDKYAVIDTWDQETILARHDSEPAAIHHANDLNIEEYNLRANALALTSEQNDDYPERYTVVEAEPPNDPKYPRIVTLWRRTDGKGFDFKLRVNENFSEMFSTESHIRTRIFLIAYYAGQGLSLWSANNKANDHLQNIKEKTT